MECEGRKRGAKILEGAKPANLLVERPATFRRVISPGRMK